jgi:glycosyltransferase involved in cell wall biosynthesis
MAEISVIVSTYNLPRHLHRCLLALEHQTHPAFEVIVADDGSAHETGTTIDGFAKTSRRTIKHVWQEDRGFRKTRILNKAILAAAGEYLVFIDGDCVAHPDFVREHAQNAKPGHYLNGSLIRLDQGLTERITDQVIIDGQAFQSGWLTRQGRRFDRRYLRLTLPYGLRCRLNDASPTRLYWLGSNSSCYRDDAVAVNGFDNRFGYGFEDADFGSRLEMRRVAARTVRWTAVLLHLWHAKPWSASETIRANRKLRDENLALNRCRAVDGLDDISAHNRSDGQA